MISAFLATTDVVSGLLRDPAVAGHWERPSALAEFRVSGLAGHLARAVFNTETWLAAPEPADGTPIDAPGYFLAGATAAPDLDGELPRRIRETGERHAEGGPAALADDFDAARGRLAALLPTLPADRLVAVAGAYGDRVLPLSECLTTRLVELLVHLDDLAVSVGLPTPAVPAAASDAVAGCLLRVSLARNGVLPVLRSLARRERATDPIAAF